MHFTQRIALLLLAPFLVVSCAFQPAIDESGNVTIRKPNALMREHAAREFEHIKRTKKICDHPRHKKAVKRVSERLRKVIHMPSADWEFVVFKDHSPNAFCLSGGKVGIHSGLFKVIGNDDALLAAVLGHEISHATANHAEQKMHHALSLLIGGAIIWGITDHNNRNHQGEALAAYTIGTYLLNTLPLSRRQEHESDKMGAIFMAKAGYDPWKSVQLWKLLKAYHHEHGGQKPEFLRTHPLDGKRIQALEEFMPIAMRHYREALKKKHQKHNKTEG